MAEALLFDKEAALERVESDLELYFELIDMFTESNAAELASITAAVKSGDSKLVGARAHAIKSALGNLGAMTSFNLALEIEKAGKSGDIAGAPALMNKLQDEVAKFLTVVGEFRKAQA